jgi:alginate O-acetyltransferase complex protein AlgI
MNFNSYIFFALLIPVIILYRVLPWNIGKVMLVLASYVFYGYAEPFYLILLFYSSVIDYIGAIFIHDAKSEFRRKVWLWISVIGNIGLLLAFKYANFMINNINLFSDIIHFEPIKNTGWLLPAGISFYTFQTLSYTVDVYRKQAEPCRNFVTFALYVSYFPQLVAGPIERATHLIKQISEKHRVPAHDLMKGLERILWGTH